MSNNHSPAAQARHPVLPMIMTVLDGRVTTNVAMLPHALRSNRPSKAEAEVAADVIEQLLELLKKTERERFIAPPVRTEPELATRRLAAEWLREDARAARESDRNVGISPDPQLGDLLDAIATELEEQADGPDPALVSAQDLEVLHELETEMLSQGEEAAAETIARMRDVLVRVSQGRAASHWKASYERALHRLVKMRKLIPADVLAEFDVEWSARAASPPAQAVLPDDVKAQLARMAETCGAVSYSPPPLRAVRGVSMRYEQLDAFAELISKAVWPVASASRTSKAACGERASPLLERIYARLCKAQIFDLAAELRDMLEATAGPSPDSPPIANG